MALKTRHISFILHLSEVKYTTRLVIRMDIDGLRWVPMDPIGFHSKNGYRWIPSDNISALFEGVTNRILPIPSEKIHFPWVCIGNVWQKVDIYPT